MTSKPATLSTLATGSRSPRTPAWSLQAIVLALGVGLAALNLRTAVTSVGSALDEIIVGLGMSAVGAGILTTLPVLCFAVVGICVPALVRRFGEHHVIAAALLLVTAGLGTRVLVDSVWMFLLLSAVALSGGAIGNVLLPTLVKQHFPHRVGLMTTVYTTALALGTAVAAAGTVPLVSASGSWRLALGVYALFGLVAAVPWLLVLRREPTRDTGQSPLGVGRVLATGVGRQSVVYFATQSTIAYIMFGWFAQLLRDQGMSPAAAGMALSYLTALAIPTSLVLPGLMARTRDHRGFVTVFYTVYMCGFVGLWASPLEGTWVWATLIGLGMSSFPLALTFFAVRARTAAGTAALSATSQSLGYLAGGMGPLMFGFLHELSGGWSLPIAMVMIVATVNLATGLLLGRPRHLEDELSPGPQSVAPTTQGSGGSA
ncbi:MFS transporter [Lipingzhangella sp. LS1_29]|uniref:MFS transporter n=1 Tax=Lipingzhangella rawalii TaxID=2055835 RepID=A0ABU2H0R8_9ACTN|nr:MFS transporter [Lipingzhangella rawalii]MDS1268898.1 MFS transporter [Lipingzhangella rawalii]